MAYVFMGKIIDVRHYSGVFSITPNFHFLNDIAKNNIDFPIAYTIDVAILKNNENTVIEYNDMWAIGNYGLDNITYKRLISNRYFEIVKNI